MADISILDVIKKGGYEASLITTFNAHLPFYEELVLRKLVGAGCRHNVVIMDKKQCAASWSNESSRPRLAGQAYTLLPIGVPGAFHPKICILVGPKKAAVLIGSHNLTLSGFGYNHEITNFVEIDTTKDKDGVNLLAQAWQVVKKWIELERGKLPDALLESAIELENFISPFTINSDDSSAVAVIYQTPGEQSLIEQLGEIVPHDIKRIGVLGAFFDNEFTFLKELSTRWPAAELVVGIDPATVQLVGDTNHLKAKFVDANLACAIKPNTYLHAKIIYLELSSGIGFYLSGSANPSRPAWMGNQHSCNIEAMLIRRGSDAAEIAETTGVIKLFSRPSIDSAILESIAQRNKSTIQDKPELAVPLLLGVANQKLNEILIHPCGNLIKSNALEICDSDMNVLATVSIDWNGTEALRVQIENVLHLACSCKLLYQDVLVAQAMLHHPEVISSTSNSSKQRQIRNALEALSSGSGDISGLISSVEKIIFSDDAHHQVINALNENKQKSIEKEAKAPETLAASINDSPVLRKKYKLIKSGDLAYLLDILIRRLGEGLVTSSVETDPSGRNEEEQVGTEDESPVGTDETELPKTTLTDIEIASAVSRRAHQLVTKMTAQLERASLETDLQVTAILQLIAVIGLIRELRHLDNTQRWKMTGKSLAADQDRQQLFDQSVKYLFGKSQFLQGLGTENETLIDEVFRLKLLLLWLAWDLGLEASDEIERLLEKSTRDTQLKTNAFFTELLPSIINDNESRLELEIGISRTIRQTPKEAYRSQAWIDKHWNIGRRSSPIEPGLIARRGSYCIVPGVINSPRVILEIPNGFVSLWNFDEVRTFERSRVKVLI